MLKGEPCTDMELFNMKKDQLDDYDTILFNERKRVVKMLEFRKSFENFDHNTLIREMI